MSNEEKVVDLSEVGKQKELQKYVEDFTNRLKDKFSKQLTAQIQYLPQGAFPVINIVDIPKEDEKE